MASTSILQQPFRSMRSNCKRPSMTYRVSRGKSSTARNSSKTIWRHTQNTPHPKTQNSWNRRKSAKDRGLLEREGRHIASSARRGRSPHHCWAGRRTLVTTVGRAQQLRPGLSLKNHARRTYRASPSWHPEALFAASSFAYLRGQKFRRVMWLWELCAS